MKNSEDGYGDIKVEHYVLKKILPDVGAFGKLKSSSKIQQLQLVIIAQ